MNLSQAQMAGIYAAQRTAALHPQVKICLICSAYFFAEHKGQKYCGPEHSHLGRKASKRKWWKANRCET